MLPLLFNAIFKGRDFLRHVLCSFFDSEGWKLQCLNCDGNETRNVFVSGHILFVKWDSCLSMFLVLYQEI